MNPFISNKNTKLFLVILLSFVFVEANAQQTASPSDNQPIVVPPVTYPVVSYPGLGTLNNNLKYNYIRTVVPDVPVTTLPASNYLFRSSADYFDGLGRPLQSIAVKAHKNGNDIVTAHAYDELGREQVEYPPFAAPISLISAINPSGKMKLEINTQMHGFYDNAGHDEQPFSQTTFDNSPLNKVIKQMQPGRSWVGSGRGVSYDYRGNEANEVRLWTIGSTNTSIPITTAYYNAHELSVTKSTDEDGKISITYKDKSGNTILHKIKANDNATETGHSGFACTYYIYDNQNHLRYVIPPEAVDHLLTTWNIASSLNNGTDICFSYFYDQLGRLVEKKIPGKDIEYYVYDKRNRLIMYQDGNLRSHYPDGLARWHFTYYDALDRQTMTTICIANEGRPAMAGYITDNSVWGTNHWLYYFKNYNLMHVYADPGSIANSTIMTYTYYDDYTNLQSLNLDFDQNQFSSVTYPTDGSVSHPVFSSITSGLQTGGKTLVLNPDVNNGNQYLASAIYYDEMGRVIQNQSQNIKGGIEKSSNVYYFQGTLYQNILQHQNPNAKQIAGSNDGPLTSLHIFTTYTRNFSYGGGNDLVASINKKIENSSLNYPFANYSYDHLGRVVVKQLPAGNILQEYNMRGFLNHIYVVNSNNQTNLVDPDTQIFEENLFYDKGFKSQLYNGNIAGITWHMKGNSAPHQAYGYSYDDLNRITHAEYGRQETPSSSWSKVTYDYTASNITYDLNGNIKTMAQQGPNSSPTGAPILMDNLVYTYSANSNRLIKVEDGPDLNPSLPDFKNASNATTEYTYDNNGNLITDANKGISTPTTYSFLNQPSTITVPNKGLITYVYDASGNQLQKKLHYLDGSGKPDEKWDYIGSFVYKNDTLQYILNEEGRSRPIVDVDDPNYPTKFVYDYFVKDHLGNVRSTITANPINHEYMARHDLAQANIEQLVFDNIPNVRGAKPGSTDPNDNMAARLDGGNPNTRVGTALLLSVMSGERFDISVDAFYEGDYKQQDVSNGSEVINSLMGALMGGTNYDGVPLSELPDNIKTVQTIFSNPNLANQIDQLTSTDNDPNAPKAHLNYLFFDDRMNLISEYSGSLQVPSNIGGWTNLHPSNCLGCQPCTHCTIQGPVAPSNAANLLVYIDNQSIGKEVWFDNLSVEHYTSEVLEEDHYYPFGLTLQTTPDIPGITKNNNKYQSIGLEKHFGLETYETYFRGLNPQIGRFNSVDPKAELDYSSSTYAVMENNPALNVDPLGDENTIYLINLPGSGLSQYDMQNFAASLNQSFKDLGLTMTASVYQESEPINASLLDKTDGVALFGDAESVASYANKYMGNELDASSLSHENNPEQTKGTTIGINSKVLTQAAKQVNSTRDDMASYLVLHGTGHIANPSTFEQGHMFGEGGALLWPGYMVFGKTTGGSSVVDGSLYQGEKDPKIKNVNDLKTKSNNGDYINKVKEHFNSGQANANYHWMNYLKKIGLSYQKP